MDIYLISTDVEPQLLAVRRSQGTSEAHTEKVKKPCCTDPTRWSSTVADSPGASDGISASVPFPNLSLAGPEAPSPRFITVTVNSIGSPMNAMPKRLCLTRVMSRSGGSPSSISTGPHAGGRPV